jgi:hypothetical protein
MAHRKELEPKTWTETYDEVDVDLCRPHPLVVGMRFENQSESLEQNIRENGQLVPCRAVRDENDGIHLLIYIGQRRFYAVKSLKTKFETRSTIKVIIDEDDISDEEIIKRALAENVDENGQRLPLSDLEKVSYCRNLLKIYNKEKTEKILINAGLERSTAKKIVLLVDKFDNLKVERLHKIECKSNFTFRIAHLDLLLLSEDDKNLYETASLAAFSQKPPEEIRTLGRTSGFFSKDIPWFKDIFPDFVHSEEETDKESELKAKSEPSLVGEDLPREQGTIQDTNSKAVSNIDSIQMGTDLDKGALPEPVIAVSCHYCKSLHLFKLRTGSPEFIFCNLKEGGLIEQFAIGANAVYDCERECPTCKKSFWVNTSVLDGGKIVVSTSRTKVTMEPKDDACVRRAYWDQEEEKWMLYDEVTRNKYALNPTENFQNKFNLH